MATLNWLPFLETAEDSFIAKLDIIQCWPVALVNCRFTDDLGSPNAPVFWAFWIPYRLTEGGSSPEYDAWNIAVNVEFTEYVCFHHDWISKPIALPAFTTADRDVLTEIAKRYMNSGSA